jgi:CubicO group peptidase (beta-lactamase class C family)
MAVTITHGPDVLYVNGIGSDGHGHDVTPATQFRIASLSKSFTAVAVLQLVEAGKVELDALVKGYLPEFGTTEPAGGNSSVPGFGSFRNDAAG